MEQDDDDDEAHPRFFTLHHANAKNLFGMYIKIT